MNDKPLSQGQLIKLVSVRLLLLVPLLFAMFFLPAGTLYYWEAWVYMGVLLIPMFFVMLYLLKNDPQLLERRMRMREKETQQKRIIYLSYLYFLVTFLLPGFDRRYGWSEVPVWVVLLADAIVFLGYLIFFLVLRENRYASRIVQVEQEQQVISSGPYSVVRHPMYVGASLMYLLTPLALGSWWAMLPALLLIPLIVARIQNEEKILVKELKGYPEYMQRVKYRLLPGLW